MKKEQVAKLLNRTLTSAEVSNFEMYIKIATERLEQLLCFRFCGEGENRTYLSREGYSTLYIDPYTAITSVTVDGVATTDYIKKQNDRYDGEWYNIIEFDDKMIGKKVVVEASWGFDSIPYDLQLLIAKLFTQGTVEQTADNQVKSKSIEDFQVTYKDGATFDEFIGANQATIQKYSQCGVGNMRQGDVCTI